MRASFLCSLVLLALASGGCAEERKTDVTEKDFAALRNRMVSEQIAARDIKDEKTLQVMRKVPRHKFVPESIRHLSYVDSPLPIGEGQTISQPYIVAFMTEALELKPQDRVLEIGTGSGYQAAILAEISKEVYTIEILPGLGRRAEETLTGMGYTNAFVRIGDGYKGWPEKAPFDAIIVTCAPEEIPPALAEELKEGGRMIIPVGEEDSVQRLVRVVKEKGTLKKTNVLDVRFVPMVKSKE